VRNLILPPIFEIFLGGLQWSSCLGSGAVEGVEKSWGTEEDAGMLMGPGAEDRQSAHARFTINSLSHEDFTIDAPSVGLG
jgi:hypothetical protein